MKDRKRRLGVVMDPIASIKPVKDSTLAMLLEAQSRDWELSYLEQGANRVGPNRLIQAQHGDPHSAD